MNGWSEWALLGALMVVGGIVVVGFFISPLIGLALVGACLMANWLVQPTPPPPRPIDQNRD